MAPPLKKLSHRLQFVKQQLIPHAPVWDLCCDHGLVGLHAWQSQIYSEVHLVDCQPNVMQTLQNNIAKYIGSDTSGLFTHQLHAEEIGQPVEGNIIITGVGDGTVFSILNSLHQNKVLSATRLILSPQRNNSIFVQEMQSHHPQYRLTSCKEISEGGWDYHIYVYDKSYSNL